MILCKHSTEFHCLHNLRTSCRFINGDTLHSLQIIGSESHPHSHNQGPKNTGSKEGLSLYGLFHHLARTPQGKYLLRQYFLRPSLNFDVIDERLNTIAIFLRPENADTMDNLVKDLKSVRNIRTIMINLRKGVSSGGKAGGFSKNVWVGLRQFAYHALQIRDSMRDMAGGEHLAIRNKVSEAQTTRTELRKTLRKNADIRTGR